MTRRSAEREAFLSSVITTAVEGGTGYWAQVSEYKWEGLPEREVFAVLHEMTGDDDGESYNGGGEGIWEEWYKKEGLRLDIGAVARAIGIITRGEGRVEAGCNPDGSAKTDPLGDFAVKTIAGASAINDGGEIDADMADIITQIALLGVVRYG